MADMVYFFERGSGPLISIMIPTRGRPEHLVRSIDSCVSLAKDHSLLEFCLKIDEDDLETIKVVKKLEATVPINIKKVISPRGRGMADLHLYFTELCKVSTGDWLALYNDDARMTVEGWDQILLMMGIPNPWPGMDKVCCAIFPTIGRPFVQEFPVIRRGIFEILGHYSRSPHNDTWLHRVMISVNVEIATPIFVEHLSNDMDDSVRDEGQKIVQSTGWTVNSIGAISTIHEDAGKLIDYLKKVKESIVWTTVPTSIGWNWHKESIDDPELGENVIVDQIGSVGFFESGRLCKTVHYTEVGGVWAKRI